MITREKFNEIFENDSDRHCMRSDDIFAGLEIMRKYLPSADIEAAEHDIVYVANCDEIIDAGITEEDAKMLRALGWMDDEDSMAHFA